MVTTFDPKLVVITVGGTPISGFADGTFIRVERETDTFTKVVGADGFVSRAKSNNKSGSITITLAQTSNSNSVLNALSTADELSNNGVVPCMIKDLSGTSTYFSSSAWVRKPSNAEFGKEISNREWVLDCADISMKTEGNFPSL